VDEVPRVESGGDRDFVPDLTLKDGGVLQGDGWALEAIATPGHCANHMAYALKGTDVMFSGDHVMAWSSTVVSPPDGAMSDYMASLEKLTHRAETTYFPGHGGAVKDAPRFVKFLIRHRQAREASILRRLGKGEADIPTIVKTTYIGLDPKLIRAAGRSVLAHLEDLVARGKVATDGTPAIDKSYRLADG
jgi:glyoxylase-like metal-dependent hydrolase (beta-lactamase superfamily II)